MIWYDMIWYVYYIWDDSATTCDLTFHDIMSFIWAFWMMEHQLLIVSPRLDDSMFRRGLLKRWTWTRLHKEHLVEGLKGHYIYIEAKPLGQSFPCAVTGYLHLRRREKEEGQRQGREGKKRANMLAAAAFAPVGRRWQWWLVDIYGW